MYTEPQTVRTMLRLGAALLVEHGVPNAQRNAEWLLCDSLGCSVLDLYADSGEQPAAERARVFWENIHRRANREPLQHILGSTEFMSLPFMVARDVFVPRPDTEILVELAESRLRAIPLDRDLAVMDLCCGSGVIAVSLAARIPNLKAVAVDVCARAAESTRINATQNGVDGRVAVVEADAERYLVDGDSGAGNRPSRQFAAIVCNPPYIETDELPNLPPEVSQYEPPKALDGGADGLDFYRRVTKHLVGWLRPSGFAAFEIGDHQGSAVTGILERAGFVDISVTPDLADSDRVVIGLLPAS